MLPASRTPMDRPAPLGPTGDLPDDPAGVERLSADLARMRMYALALEERCNHLWSAIPGSEGASDPMVPYLALHCSMSVPDRGDLA
jgi:hypothetical protein